MKKYIIAILGLSICLSACGNSTATMQEYQFMSVAKDSEQSFGSFGTLEPLAGDVAIVGDESAYIDDKLTSKSGLIVDVTDRQVVFSKNANERIYPASVTKIMTAYLAFKYCNLDDIVTITDDAMVTEAGSKLCYIKPGDKLTVRQLLNGTLVTSGNDCAAALAVHISGSIDEFVKLMNSEAYALGAVNSHFVNPHGLHNDDHYTTAYDLYLIFNQLIKYEEAKTIVNTTSYTTTYTLADGTSKEATWTSTNKYLSGEYTIPDGITVIGGKTGYTDQAGYNLILLSNDAAGKSYISIVTGNSDYYTLYTNMSTLLRKVTNN